MGLFDYIRCEYPLPGTSADTDIDFHSKDLSRTMHQYTITASGQLIAAPYPSGMREDWSEFSGTVRFYKSEITGPQTYRHLEYEATFVKGRVEEVREVLNFNGST